MDDGAGRNTFVPQPLEVHLDDDCLEGDNDEVVTVSCGAFHTAAVTARGHVLVWGKGRAGALGLGDENNRYRPTRVPGLRLRPIGGERNTMSTRGGMAEGKSNAGARMAGGRESIVSSAGTDAAVEVVGDSLDGGVSSTVTVPTVSTEDAGHAFVSTSPEKRKGVVASLAPLSSQPSRPPLLSFAVTGTTKTKDRHDSTVSSGSVARRMTGGELYHTSPPHTGGSVGGGGGGGGGGGRVGMERSGSSRATNRTIRGDSPTLWEDEEVMPEEDALNGSNGVDGGDGGDGGSAAPPALIDRALLASRRWVLACGEHFTLLLEHPDDDERKNEEEDDDGFAPGAVRRRGGMGGGRGGAGGGHGGMGEGGGNGNFTGMLGDSQAYRDDASMQSMDPKER